MAYELIRMVLIGNGLSSRDALKIVPLTLNCTDQDSPAPSITQFNANFASLPGTRSGWAVSYINSTATMVNVSSTQSGTFSVCTWKSSCALVVMVPIGGGIPATTVRVS